MNGCSWDGWMVLIKASALRGGRRPDGYLWYKKRKATTGVRAMMQVSESCLHGYVYPERGGFKSKFSFRESDAEGSAKLAGVDAESA